MNTNITMNTDTDTNDFVKAPQTITNANKNKPPKLPLVIMVVTVVISLIFVNDGFVNDFVNDFVKL